jgi:6-phosphogluconolactonase
MPGSLNIHIEKTPEGAARFTAERVVQILSSTLEKHESVSLVLSGGETPRRVYQILGSDSFRHRVAWDRVQFFFGDERMVSPDHPDSNYGMARRELFEYLSIPTKNIYRIKGELTAEESALDYAEELHSIYQSTTARFDCVLLGIGEDGHTASLFPGTDALYEKRKSAVALFVPRLKAWRVTLTFPVINNAHNVIFLAEGGKKASIVQKVIESAAPTPDMPATMVRPLDGTLHWVLDAEAASQIR